MLHFWASQTRQEWKKCGCKSDHAQMMDLQQVTEDVGIVSTNLTYCLAKNGCKAKKGSICIDNTLSQPEPEFYSMDQSNLT